MSKLRTVIATADVVALFPSETARPPIRSTTLTLRNAIARLQHETIRKRRNVIFARMSYARYDCVCVCAMLVIGVR